MKSVIIKILYNIFFIFGASFSFFLVFGLFADLRGIDKSTKQSETHGSIVIEEADFNNFFGIIPTGVVKHGFVSDYYINCSTGAISFKIRGFKFDYSYFSKQAFNTYKPRDACSAGGFDLDF